MDHQFRETDGNRSRSTFLSRLRNNRTLGPALAVLLAISTAKPAWATIDNTVTATGSSPGNTDDVTASDSLSVDVEDAAPSIAVTKTADVTSNVPVGDTVTYTYTVENTGNVTLASISLSESHEGSGPDPVPGGMSQTTDVSPTSDSSDGGGDQVWDSLAPGDIITWTATYVITQEDLNTNGGGDNDIDNTVTATASSPGNTDDVTLTASESVDIEDLNPSLQVVKSANDTTDVALNQVITYTYTVTNNGNVPISNITLNDVHGGSGPDPVPGNETILTDSPPTSDSSDAAVNGSWDVLSMGDVITFTATYTVTQTDIDNQ